jgi:hypothetical protein
MRHLRKPSKSTTDRDKIDFLMVQYFALCAPPKIYHKQIELTDVAGNEAGIWRSRYRADFRCEPLKR